MRVYLRVSAMLLMLASALAIAAAVYVARVGRNPKSITSYPMLVVIQPSLSTGEIATFVVVEHVLVASAVAFLYRGAHRGKNGVHEDA